MGFFRGWYSAYLDPWFDGSSSPPPPPSGNGGVSNSLALSHVAPKPRVPVWRQIPGAVGTAFTEIRQFLSDASNRQQLWGNHVTVTFAAAATPTKVATGLSGVPKGYQVVKASADVRVFDAPPPTITTDRGVIWLQASAPATVTIYLY